MSSAFFVEVLSRNEEVLHRHRLNALPISLGRGYDNDFIVDDPHASPHHAIVEQSEDGGLLMRDLDSRNGLICKRRRQSLVALDGNTIVRLGHTNLRVRAADFPVADALPDTTVYGWEGWPPALAGLLMIVLLAGISTWISDSNKFDPILYLMGIVTMLAGALAWSGIWSFANRLFGGHMRFGRHLFIVACGLAAAEACDVLGSTLGYAFSWEMLTRYGNHAIMAIGAGTVFFHLLTLNPRHPKRFARIALMLGLLGSGLILMGNYQRSGRLADDLYMHTLLPPAVRASTGEPVAQFISDAAQLKASVDAERGKAMNGDEIETAD